MKKKKRVDLIKIKTMNQILYLQKIQIHLLTNKTKIKKKNIKLNNQKHII